MSNERQKPPSWNVIRTFLASLATLGVMAVLVWKVKPGPILDAIAGSDLPLLAAGAVVALFFSTVQASELLRCMLGGFSEKVTFTQSLGATAGNMAIKAALPAGTGELVRVVYLNRAHGVGIANGTAAIVTILWCKLIWLLVLAVAGWLMLPDRSLVQGVAISTCGLLVVALPAILVRSGRRMLERPRPASRWRAVLYAIAQSTTSMRASGLALGAGHALLAVLAEMGVFALVLHAAGGPVDPVAVLAFLPLAVMGAKLPLTILGLGTREVLIVLLLAGTAAEPTLAGAAIVFSAVKYVVPAIAGGLLTWGYVRRLMGSGR